MSGPQDVAGGDANQAVQAIAGRPDSGQAAREIGGANQTVHAIGSRLDSGQAVHAIGQTVHIIGGGLAGSEAALQLAFRGVNVVLHEMRPTASPPTHTSGDLAELVCSNSFKSTDLGTAQGLLKEELRRMGSALMRIAEATALPAGAALAVDRTQFSAWVTRCVTGHPNIRVVRECVHELPNAPCIVASGPLTQGELGGAIEQLVGEPLHFYDAAAPVVMADSLDMNRIFAASRHGKGGSDYLNCPMNEAEYETFLEALRQAECAPVHGFEDKAVFEGCLPVEVLAGRGRDTLRFGAMKPVGLTDPKTDRRPYAVVQLRRENAAGTMYNLVGFQTRLTFPEQRRVFGMIPGLGRAEYARYGVMHRNTFIRSPGRLMADYRLKAESNGVGARSPVWIVGQLTGTEGYMAAIAGGLTAACGAYAYLKGMPPPDFTAKTVMGGLAHYVSEYIGKHFQPMGPAFGLLEPIVGRMSKPQRYQAYTERSLALIDACIPDFAGEVQAYVDTFWE